MNTCFTPMPCTATKPHTTTMPYTATKPCIATIPHINTTPGATKNATHLHNAAHHNAIYHHNATHHNKAMHYHTATHHMCHQNAIHHRSEPKPSDLSLHDWDKRNSGRTTAVLNHFLRATSLYNKSEVIRTSNKPSTPPKNWPKALSDTSLPNLQKSIISLASKLVKIKRKMLYL